MESSRPGEKLEDLLEMKEESCGDKAQPKADMDGGWSWVVCFGAFIVNFLTVGQQNTAGVLYSALLREYSTKRGDTAWVFSLASSTMYLFAAVATTLAERFGSRAVVIVASLVSALGLLASSFARTLLHLCVAYGVIWGLGASLGLFSSITILTKYFRSRLAMASGIALAGAAVGGLVYGPLIQALSMEFGIAVSFRILAGLQSLMFISAFSFRPKVEGTVQMNTQRSLTCDVFHNRGYTIWAAALCTFMVVFLVPPVHLVRFAEDKGVSHTQASFLPGYSGIGVLLGSLAFGLLCDKFNRIKVCQLTFLSIAISSTLLTFAKKYEWICVFAFTFGVLYGGYETLVPVITHDLLGPRRVALGIGMLYCLMSFPKILGPPIAGLLFDTFDNYSISFYFTGAVTILSTVITCFLHRVPLPEHRKQVKESLRTSFSTTAL